MDPYRIVLADDHTSFRESLKKLIDGVDDLKVVGECSDGLELLNSMEKLAPDMIILDITMPHIGGIEAAIEIRKRYPEVRIVMLTIHNESEYISQAISSGAKGYVTKESVDSELFAAIKAVRKGGSYFPNDGMGDAGEYLLMPQ